jgi:NADH-quinone oxidoreductase subunit I
MIVSRPSLAWHEKLYLSAIFTGMLITLKHMIARFSGRTAITLSYPEQKWTMPVGYRGAPTLVKDEAGREKCVSCQLCEFICPPRAIRMTPGSIPLHAVDAKVEKAPREFLIDMTRCIYCGLCEEVCPEEAIYLRADYALTGLTRAELIHNKAKLYELGGVMVRPVKKWAQK